MALLMYSCLASSWSLPLMEFHASLDGRGDGEFDALYPRHGFQDPKAHHLYLPVKSIMPGRSVLTSPSFAVCTLVM